MDESTAIISIILIIDDNDDGDDDDDDDDYDNDYDDDDDVIRMRTRMLATIMVFCGGTKAVKPQNEVTQPHNGPNQHLRLTKSPVDHDM